LDLIKNILRIEARVIVSLDNSGKQEPDLIPNRDLGYYPAFNPSEEKAIGRKMNAPSRLLIFHG